MAKLHRRLARSQVIRALTRLGELCAASNTKAEIAIYGGAVMMIAFNCREMTKDVDAIFEPQETLDPLIAQVAREQKLPEDWLNAARGRRRAARG